MPLIVISAYLWAALLSVVAFKQGGVMSLAASSPLSIGPVLLAHWFAQRKQKKLNNFVSQFLEMSGHTDEKFIYMNDFSALDPLRFFNQYGEGTSSACKEWRDKDLLFRKCPGVGDLRYGFQDQS